MVLVYRVDVKALAPAHCANVLGLANASGAAPLLRLDEFWYGVVYQDRARVLGVALVARRGEDHAIERLCVLESERNRGIGTEVLGIVKEQLAPGAVASLEVPDECERRDAFASFLATSDFAAGQDGVYRFRRRDT